MDENAKRYMLEQLRALLAIDSTTGDTGRLQDYLAEVLEGFNITPRVLRKGGLIFELGGEGRPLLFFAHGDDIGGMVRYINKDGSLKMTTVGGLPAYTAIGDNVRVTAKSGRVFSGTVHRIHSSVHVAPAAELEKLPDFDATVAVYLDEDVRSADDVKALGIDMGDFIALEPRFAEENGYLKSRFLDDKVCVALLLALVREVKEGRVKPARKVWIAFTMWEEVGLGGNYLPDGVEDVVALDIAVTGEQQASDLHKATICAKDARYPYSRSLLIEMWDKAKEAGADAVIDVFTPRYGSDADATMDKGYDVRHGLIGPGTQAAHGYERTHIDALVNTYKLVKALCE